MDFGSHLNLAKVVFTCTDLLLILIVSGLLLFCLSFFLEDCSHDKKNRDLLVFDCRCLTMECGAEEKKKNIGTNQYCT